MQNVKANRSKAVAALIIAAIVIYSIGLTIQFFGEFELHWALWLLPLIYLTLSIITFRILTSGAHKSPHRFIMGVNLSVLLKLITSASICGVYFALKLPAKMNFTIAVMLNYIIFTAVLLKSVLKSVSNG